MSNVPLLPVFTENIRESFRVLPFGGDIFHWIFTKTRLPLRPVFGGFPVKLRTHIGEPIYPEENMTPEMLRQRSKVEIVQIEQLSPNVLYSYLKVSMELLIHQHQRVPGSIWRGLLDRFT